MPLQKIIFINYQLVKPLFNDFHTYRITDDTKDGNYKKIDPEKLNISAFIAEMMQINSIFIICYILLF